MQSLFSYGERCDRGGGRGEEWREGNKRRGRKREEGREGGKKEGREGGREGGREEEREGGTEGGRDNEREGEREGGMSYLASQGRVETELLKVLGDACQELGEGEVIASLQVVLIVPRVATQLDHPLQHLVHRHGRHPAARVVVKALVEDQPQAIGTHSRQPLRERDGALSGLLVVDPAEVVEGVQVHPHQVARINKGFLQLCGKLGLRYDPGVELLDGNVRDQ